MFRKEMVDFNKYDEADSALDLHLHEKQETLGKYKFSKSYLYL
jgi:hypothetical protein